jgi:hypothetical protein
MRVAYLKDFEGLENVQFKEGYSPPPPERLITVRGIPQFLDQVHAVVELREFLLCQLQRDPRVLYLLQADSLRITSIINLERPGRLIEDRTLPNTLYFQEMLSDDSEQWTGSLPSSSAAPRLFNLLNESPTSIPRGLMLFDNKLTKVDLGDQRIEVYECFERSQQY